MSSTTTTAVPFGPRVPAWLVTREMLREWGFPVRDCSTGHGEVTAGPSFHSARHAAWVAGFVAMVGEPESVRAARLAPRSRLTLDAEMLAWVESEKAKAATLAA